MSAKVGEFKGHATIQVSSSTVPFPFGFGLSKAVLILEHLEEIADFVKDYGNAEQRESYSKFIKNWTYRKLTAASSTVQKVEESTDSEPPEILKEMLEASKSEPKPKRASRKKS